ncbi:hypothetical protein B0H17DRAFT_1150428 [Mycena rosella]|uniref:Uncharacterized protein n=1 Tax=Mycena rosella TaxID=1033263 RepID=A0AAD7FNH3_MYCRO|nr:hypothetical protein B0H17DRAFT_1150428 [Mycena rosella]
MYPTSWLRTWVRDVCSATAYIYALGIDVSSFKIWRKVYMCHMYAWNSRGKMNCVWIPNGERPAKGSPEVKEKTGAPPLLTYPEARKSKCKRFRYDVNPNTSAEYAAVFKLVLVGGGNTHELRRGIALCLAPSCSKPSRSPISGPGDSRNAIVLVRVRARELALQALQRSSSYRELPATRHPLPSLTTRNHPIGARARGPRHTKRRWYRKEWKEGFTPSAASAADPSGFAAVQSHSAICATFDSTHPSGWQCVIYYPSAAFLSPRVALVSTRRVRARGGAQVKAFGTGQGYTTERFLNHLTPSGGFVATDCDGMVRNFRTIILRNSSTADIIRYDNSKAWGNQPNPALLAESTKNFRRSTAIVGVHGGKKNKNVGEPKEKYTLEEKFGPLFEQSIQENWIAHLGPLANNNPSSYKDELPTWSSTIALSKFLEISSFKTGLTAMQLVNTLSISNIIQMHSVMEMAEWIPDNPTLGAVKL